MGMIVLLDGFSSGWFGEAGVAGLLRWSGGYVKISSEEAVIPQLSGIIAYLCCLAIKCYTGLQLNMDKDNERDE
jgi:hypothetical protein